MLETDRLRSWANVVAFVALLRSVPDQDALVRETPDVRGCTCWIEPLRKIGLKFLEVLIGFGRKDDGESHQAILCSAGRLISILLNTSSAGMPLDGLACMRS